MNRYKLFKICLILNDESKSDFLERFNQVSGQTMPAGYLTMILKGVRDHKSHVASMAIKSVDSYIANTIRNHAVQIIQTIEVLRHEG
ncbi:MAG: hypothetical protein ACOCTM_01865 [Bacteroidota bacterium]